MKHRRARYHLNFQRNSTGTTFSCLKKPIVGVVISGGQWGILLSTYWANYPLVESRNSRTIYF